MLKIQRESGVWGSPQLARNRDNFQQASSQNSARWKTLVRSTKRKEENVSMKEWFLACVYVSCFKIFGQYRIYTNKISLQKLSMWSKYFLSHVRWNNLLSVQLFCRKHYVNPAQRWNDPIWNNGYVLSNTLCMRGHIVPCGRRDPCTLWQFCRKLGVYSSLQMITIQISIKEYASYYLNPFTRYLHP